MAITEFMAIVPSFVISLSIFMNVPTEFFTSVILIFPLFLAFSDAILTFCSTVSSSIKAIPTDLSALSTIFFLKLISPPARFSIIALGPALAANFIP